MILLTIEKSGENYREKRNCNNFLISKKSFSMQYRKLVGHVTPEEKDEIQTIFERRNGLNELAKIVTPDNVELYEKLVKDLGETTSKFQHWWDNMANKYNWETTENGRWEITFDKCEIYLLTTE